MSEIKKIFGMKEKPFVDFVRPERQSVEQTEDYAVKKVIATKELTLSDGSSAGYVMNDADGKLTGGNSAYTINKTRWFRAFNSNPSTTTFTNTAGRVYLNMIQIPNNVTAEGIAIYNYATVSGNVIVGLYGPVALGTDTPVDAPLIATSADTALNGANSSQFISFTSNIPLNAGLYYLAVEFSSSTHTSGANGLTGIPNANYTICFYNRGGGYGALTNPCPAISGTLTAQGALLRCV